MNGCLKTVEAEGVTLLDHFVCLFLLRFDDCIALHFSIDFGATSVESQKLFKKIRSDFFGCRRTQIEVNLEKLVRSVCASRRKKRPNLFEEFMRLDTSQMIGEAFFRAFCKWLLGV